jgi:hypothetical protein
VKRASGLVAPDHVTRHKQAGKNNCRMPLHPFNSRGRASVAPPGRVLE